MELQFKALGIQNNLLKALIDLKIENPTEIQQKSIPILLSNEKDFIGVAKTGTGKTLAFALPLLQLIDLQKTKVQAIILVPTRELGQQIFVNLEKFAKYLPEISMASTCGGIPIKPQIERLQTKTHIVVATPGRLLDLVQRQAIDIRECSFLVLDEADEMATALKESLEEIISFLPKSKRTWLFSATMPGTVKQLVQNYMSKNSVQVNADMQTIGNLGIDHQYVVVNPIEKLDILMHFLNSKDGQRGIIFCKTKAAVNKLSKNLAINKFSSGAIHGSLTQPIRDRIMEQFRAGYINILIATDLAARGIDVPETSFVVNYHLPDVYETYVHRSGRTARAGAKGLSLTILQSEEVIEIPAFEKELGIKFVLFQKPNAQNIDDNNALLWAKQIFKSKPNQEIDADLKDKIKTIFHHLTKEELTEKLISHFYLQSKNDNSEKNIKKQKRS
jgi:ATP-dependent RNA helicase DeaD